MKRGEEERIEVEPGTYQLMVKVGGTRATAVRSQRRRIELTPGGQQRVTCKPKAGNNLLHATALTLFGSNRWIDVELG